MKTTKSAKRFETLSAALEAAMKAGKDPRACRDAGFRWIDEQLEADKITTVEARMFEGQLIDYGKEWPSC